MCYSAVKCWNRVAKKKNMAFEDYGINVKEYRGNLNDFTIIVHYNIIIVHYDFTIIIVNNNSQIV